MTSARNELWSYRHKRQGRLLDDIVSILQRRAFSLRFLESRLDYENLRI